MEPMSLLVWVVVGLIAGWLASHVVASRFGRTGDTLVGMAGALIGGFLFHQFGATGTTGFNIWSIFVAFTGAVVLLGVIRLVSGRRKLRT
jgi:uncharacterized membrane protein YeaQ/YmgE (transglycosylase-associated protein family)